MQIIGTAGHVDHGKSSLVTALTGTNPDRWIEEQRRGMTLDLGFAHLRFDDGREAGIVDVPGHERFLHNMLAGAAGMDVLLLVVAANEGIMPQTREHLEIARFLNVKRVVVALTKMDLVEPGAGGAVCRELRDALAGTIACDAPIFAVSIVTGEQLDLLKAGLALELAAVPQRNDDAPVYLPVDRAFTVPGRGTIVTGTLMQGRIAVGDSLALAPAGRSVRVRALQVFGEDRDAATGGTRVALNLAGVERDEVRRGHVLVDAAVEARTTFQVTFEPLADAVALMRRRTPVRAHIGSAEILGTLTGSTLHLREPTVALPGTRFVLRCMSPKTLLGGGEIVAAEMAAFVEMPDALESALAATLRSEPKPFALAALAFATNAREAVVQRALESLVARGDAVRLERPVEYIDPFAVGALADAAIHELQALHEGEPWALGATSLALARSLGANEALLVRMLAGVVDDGRIALRAGYYSMPSHQPRLTAEQRQFFESAMPYDAATPWLPVDFATVAKAVKASPVRGISRAFDTLLARGTVVKVDDALYRATQIDGIRALVERFLAEHGRMTMAEFRDLLQTSRKFAVPLLEWFDARGITIRNGDYRSMRIRVTA